MRTASQFPDKLEKVIARKLSQKSLLYVFYGGREKAIYPAVSFVSPKWAIE